MDSPTDSALLQEFADSLSESAFRKLVARHVDHVHSVALRVTRNADLARDVSQQTFARLATRPRSAPRGVSLAAWLHTTARSLSIDLVRSEESRRRRESAYQQHVTMNKPETSDWSDLEPVIDEAVESLSAADREIILLRFYRKHSHAEIGHNLNLAEDAARMRVRRALEKLRSRLAKRGIATTAAALALTLPAHAVTSAPAGLTASISTAAFAAAGTAAGGGSVATLIAMTKAHLAAIAAIAIAVPIITLQQTRNAKLKRTVDDLRTEALAPTLPPGVDSAPVPVRAVTRGASGIASLREILALGDPLNRIRELLAYIDRLPADQLGAALDELREGTPEWDPEAKMLVHMLLTRWAKEDPDAAFASLSGLDFKKRGGDATSILASLASLDPARAARWMNDPENTLVHFPKMGPILAGTITKEWVRQDPSSALAWARGLPDEQRAGAYGGLLGTLASTDPAAAAAMAATLEDGEPRQHAIGEIANTWARQAPRAALDWARSLEGSDRQAALDRTLGTWAQTEPAAAAAYLDGLASSEGIDRYLRPVASSWAIQSPSEAVAWVDAQPDGAGKNEAMGHVLWNWTTLDPQAASTWLGQQPTGPSTDAAIGGLAKAAFDSDPAGAIIWATQLSDTDTRNRAVEIGLHEWLRRDAKAATTWADQNGVTVPSPAGK